MIYTQREDSYLLEKQVKRYSKNRKVLDIGSGSGVQAIAAISSGAKSVTATDIDKVSIFHLKKLTRDNNHKINIIKSNLFNNIKKKDKFDLIIFNPPYLPEDKREDKESRRATTGGKEGDEIIIRFFKQVKPHMNNNAIILLLLSSLTPKDKIKILLSKLNLKYKIISREKLFFETLEVWKII